MNKICFSILLMTCGLSNAQMGIHTANPHPSAILDLSQSSLPGGLLLPRVALQSTTDVSTISTPATGLMIYCTNNAGTGNTAVSSGNIYKFNGTVWKKLSTTSEALSTNFPKVVAYGRKTIETPCDGITTGDFALGEISNSAILSASGAFTAPEAGYYSFAVYSKQYMPANASQVLSQAPYLTAEGLGTYTYKFRGSGYENQGASTSGIIYLTQGQTTAGWKWNLGNNTCGTTGRIRQQSVIWEFIGTSL